MRTYHPVTAFGQQAAALPVVRQGDPELKTYEFYYRGARFSNGGCVPSSLTNALIAMLDVTDHTQAIGVVRDVLTMLGNGKAATAGCEPSLLTRMESEKGSMLWVQQPCPTIRGLVEQFGGDVHYVNEALDPDEVVEAARSGQACLLMGRIRMEEAWGTLLPLLERLDAMGCGDVRIALSLAGVGTDVTAGPFSVKEDGHFVTLYMQVSEMLSEHTFYMLDSVTRGLSVYEQDAGLAYSLYSFVQKSPEACAFNRIWDVNRLAPNTLTIAPKYDHHSVDFAADLNTLDLCGYGVIMIRLPER